jgi:hypothetical protein
MQVGLILKFNVILKSFLRLWSNCIVVNFEVIVKRQFLSQHRLTSKNGLWFLNLIAELCVVLIFEVIGLIFKVMVRSSK